MELRQAKVSSGARVWFGWATKGVLPGAEPVYVEIRGVEGERVTVVRVSDLVGEMAPADHCFRVDPEALHFERPDADDP